MQSPPLGRPASISHRDKGKHADRRCSALELICGNSFKAAEVIKIYLALVSLSPPSSASNHRKVNSTWLISLTQQLYIRERSLIPERAVGAIRKCTHILTEYVNEEAKKKWQFPSPPLWGTPYWGVLFRAPGSFPHQARPPAPASSGPD